MGRLDTSETFGATLPGAAVRAGRVVPAGSGEGEGSQEPPTLSLRGSPRSERKPLLLQILEVFETVHTRWHYAIKPVTAANPGDLIVCETRDAVDGTLNRNSTAADVVAVNLNLVCPQRPGALSA